MQTFEDIGHLTSRMIDQQTSRLIDDWEALPDHKRAALLLHVQRMRDCGRFIGGPLSDGHLVLDDSDELTAGVVMTIEHSTGLASYEVDSLGRLLFKGMRVQPANTARVEL